MGGSNPYIEPAQFKLPTQKYKMVFSNLNKTVEVDPTKIPYGPTGLPGSVLNVALAHGISIDHACGGVTACATCHVKIKTGLNSCSKATEAELDQLDTAPGLSAQSRLACQCVPDGTQEIIVEVPDWNKNLIKETELGH